MKRKKRNSKIEKYFGFQKMDKKMSKMGMPKKSLLTKICAYDIENLSSQMNLQKKICDCNFFIKNLKIFSFRNINGIEWNIGIEKNES
jgi:hypothetical protein